MNRCINCNKLLTSDNKLNGRCWKCDAIYQEGYKAGLQSHPAPTDLLTDEEILTIYEKLFEDDPKTIFKLSKYGLKFARNIAKSQLSKLQQARPTEQAKQDIAHVICLRFNERTEEYWLYLQSHKDDPYYKWLLDVAGRIWRIWSFPDEQAIRADERRAERERIADKLTIYCKTKLGGVRNNRVKDTIKDLVLGLIFEDSLASLKSGEPVEEKE